MTAPQPTHDPVNEANIQERERGQLELMAALRKSNARLTADAHAKAEELAELKRELEELRTSISDVADDLLGTQDVAPTCELLARISRSHFEQRQCIATISSARQSDRDLVELRERAEGAERKLTEDDSERVAYLATIGVGPSHRSAEVWPWTRIREDAKHRCEELLSLREKLAAAEANYELLAQDFEGAKADREAADAECKRLRDGIAALLNEMVTNPHGTKLRKVEEALSALVGTVRLDQEQQGALLAGYDDLFKRVEELEAELVSARSPRGVCEAFEQLGRAALPVDGAVHFHSGWVALSELKAAHTMIARGDTLAAAVEALHDPSGVEVGQDVIVDWGDGPFEATVTREDFGADGNSERTVCVEWVVEEPVKVRKRTWCRASDCKPLTAIVKEPTP